MHTRRGKYGHVVRLLRSEDAQMRSRGWMAVEDVVSGEQWNAPQQDLRAAWGEDVVVGLRLPIASLAVAILLAHRQWNTMSVGTP